MTMKFRLYNNVHEFYYDTYDLLMRHEAQNNIILGNIINGHEGKDITGWRNPDNWLMATVSDENGIWLTALMTPPHNITLYATDNIINPEALNCLTDGLIDHDIPGVITEKTLAECFAREYTARKGLTFKVTMDQRIYELKAVNPDIKKIGSVRLLDEKTCTSFRTGLRRSIQQVHMGKPKCLSRRTEKYTAAGYRQKSTTFWRLMEYLFPWPVIQGNCKML